MGEPEMYPLVDNPTYTETYDSFQELKEHCEATFDSLNFPLSWHIYDEASEGWVIPRHNIGLDEGVEPFLNLGPAEVLRGPLGRHALPGHEVED